MIKWVIVGLIEAAFICGPIALGWNMIERDGFTGPVVFANLAFGSLVVGLGTLLVYMASKLIEED